MKLEIEDLEMVVWALEGWLDAFSDDDIFTESEIESVRKAKLAFQLIVRQATGSERTRHLRLVSRDEKDIN